MALEKKRKGPEAGFGAWSQSVRTVDVGRLRSRIDALVMAIDWTTGALEQLRGSRTDAASAKALSGLYVMLNGELIPRAKQVLRLTSTAEQELYAAARSRARRSNRTKSTAKKLMKLSARRSHPS